MAIVQQKVSDLSGQAVPDDQHFKLTVRNHPKVTEAKALDLLMAESEQLKSIVDLVICEGTLPNGETRELYYTYAAFSKVIPDEVVLRARGTRGRQPGFSPRG